MSPINYPQTLKDRAEIWKWRRDLLVAKARLAGSTNDRWIWAKRLFILPIVIQRPSCFPLGGLSGYRYSTGLQTENPTGS
jgi:hypothetical protein